MEKVAFSCFVFLTLTALFIADAAVVNTDTATNEFKAAEVVDNPLHVSGDTNQEYTEDKEPIMDRKILAELFEEDQISEEDVLALIEFGTEKPQVIFNAAEKVPLDAKEFLLWKENNPKSPRNPTLPPKKSIEVDHYLLKLYYTLQNPVLSSKDSPLTHNDLFREYYTALSTLQNPLLVPKEALLSDDRFLSQREHHIPISGQQNPLQFSNEAPGVDGAFSYWSENIPASQGALSQDHEEHLEARDSTMLKCWKTEGTELKQVPCTGSCLWYQSQWAMPRRGCSFKKHTPETIWKPASVIRYCNVDLCN